MSHGNRRSELGSMPTDYRVMVGKRVVYFTFGYRFGPLLTDGYGQPTKYQPTSENAPFWRPFEAWLAGYRKTNPPPEERPATSPSDHWDRRP